MNYLHSILSCNDKRRVHPASIITRRSIIIQSGSGAFIAKCVNIRELLVTLFAKISSIGLQLKNSKTYNKFLFTTKSRQKFNLDYVSKKFKAAENFANKILVHVCLNNKHQSQN